MNIDERVKMCMLLDFYGSLLTERQQVIAKRYFEDDASLVEIAEELGISRQGVRDALNTVSLMLEGFESKLELQARHAELKTKLTEIILSVESDAVKADLLARLKDLYKYL